MPCSSCRRSRGYQLSGDLGVLPARLPSLSEDLSERLPSLWSDFWHGLPSRLSKGLPEPLRLPHLLRAPSSPLPLLMSL
jgi:hypothetical protein